MKNKQSGQKGTIRERMKHAADSLKERARNMNEETQMNQEQVQSEEQAQDLVDKFVDAFIKQAHEKGEVNVFGIALEAKDFESLKELLTKMEG